MITKDAYTVIRSNRRSIAVEVRPDGKVIVRAPKYLPDKEIEAFVRQHEDWIVKHLQDYYEKYKARKDIPKLTKEEVYALAEEATRELPPLLEKYAKEIGVTFGRVTIRNQHTKWGSCSGKGNLNFNCLLMLAPRNVLEYIVVHELCHRKHMNHSAAFYAEVERVCPDYREAEAWLKENGDALLARNL